MTRTRYYTIGADGTINGGGTDNREQAEQWLENNDAVVDLVSGEDRVDARQKWID